MKLCQPFSPRTAALHSLARHNRHLWRLSLRGRPRGSCCTRRTGASSTSKATRGALSATGPVCPKGANTLQLVANPHRLTSEYCCAGNAATWEEKPLDWALDSRG